ncbi:hypothetical protein EN12_24265 [Vibrio cholerae]|nr:hypothetical protein EN12_24265 [Vibrio cholerae]
MKKLKDSISHFDFMNHLRKFQKLKINDDEKIEKSRGIFIGIGIGSSIMMLVLRPDSYERFSMLPVILSIASYYIYIEYITMFGQVAKNEKTMLELTDSHKEKELIKRYVNYSCSINSNLNEHSEQIKKIFSN